jgi:Bacteriophage probable baseplate hub protein
VSQRLREAPVERSETERRAVTGPVELPDFEITVNGTRLPFPAQHDVRMVMVAESVDEPAWFSVELSNWDEERLQVSWSDGTLFALGAAVEIRLGSVDDLHPVLRGEVTSLEPVFSAASPPLLTVGGYGYAHRLTRTRRSRSFTRMKDSAIVAQVGREAGLRADITDTRVTLDYVAQANQTDWAFLRERAARIGYEVFVRDKVLHFGPPATTAHPQGTLGIGREITEFRPRLSAVGQVGEVTVRGWDVKVKQALVGRGTAAALAAMGATRSGAKSADSAFGPSSLTHVDLLPAVKAEADMIATGNLTVGALGHVRATVDCGGRPTLRAGGVVQIEDAGVRFSGPYYVTAVTHTLDAEGYRTTLTVERNAA